MTHVVHEIHGLRATKIQAGPEEYGHAITITDDQKWIILSIGGMSYPAGLTSNEARLLAEQLMAAAARLDLPT